MDSPSAHEGEVEASKGEGNTLEQTAERAAAAIREATAETVDQQWRQTVALLDHQLSRQILTSSIETSISASKEMKRRPRQPAARLTLTQTSLCVALISYAKVEAMTYPYSVMRTLAGPMASSMKTVYVARIQAVESANAA